jgi:hypothetical protein
VCAEKVKKKNGRLQLMVPPGPMVRSPPAGGKRQVTLEFAFQGDDTGRCRNFAGKQTVTRSTSIQGGLHPMAHLFQSRLAAMVVFAVLCDRGARADDFRPPAVPLITVDPYMSCWSMSDKLSGDWPRHWTGKVHAMCGFVRVDGKPLRFMGAAPEVPGEATQQSLDVRATQTVYQFKAGEVNLTVTFTSPLLLDDLELLSRPANYITFDVASADGKPHAVQLYFDATAEWAVNQPGQAVAWGRESATHLDVMKVGSRDQHVLATKGDDVRIDWGYFYVAIPQDEAKTAIVTDKIARGAFATGAAPPEADDADMPRPANDRWPVLSAVMDLGTVEREPVRRHVIIAYDDLYSVEYFQQKLRAWWRRDESMSVGKMLAVAESDYVLAHRRCDTFDAELAATAVRSGSEEYARLCRLAYRQAVAAHKLVAGPDGLPLFFSKENFSNGSIGTVDVTYPSAPLFLLYNPVLVQGMMDPIFYFSESGRWKKPFAAHDVGTYPQANGQTYPEDMPVEECGNMLILAAAVAQAQGHAEYAGRHWATLTTWAEYLRREGFDPSNQLCTDDFAGHLAHNANLSIKAIIGLGGYAWLAETLGHKDPAKEFRELAQRLAAEWTKAAAAGDHTSLTFDNKNSWSQKYNLVWDRLLGLDLFPVEITDREIAFYLKHQNPFGLPLDSRKTYTKSDWILWTACMARSPDDFQALVHPVYRFANEGPSRVPLGDWHETTNGKVVGFRARSVVGGYFMKMLVDETRRRREAGATSRSAK